MKGQGKKEELENSLSLLRATLESTADGILVVNSEGKIESFNQKFVDMWRIPAPVAASRDDNQALAYVLDQLKDPEGFLAKVRELYSQQDAESFDVLEFKDGRVFERYSLPQRIGKKSIGRVWNFRDVTEQRRAAGALRESEERFRSAFEDAAIGMDLVSLDGRFFRVNRSLCKMLGYSEQEMLAMSISDISHPDDMIKSADYHRQILAGEITHFHMEKRYIHKKGHIVWALLSVSVVRDAKGSPTYFIGQIQDITDSKRAEQESLKRHSELSVLYKISSAISHALDMNELLTCLLDAVTGIEVFNLLRKGAIFFVDGDRMKLAFSLGCPDNFDIAHNGMKVGDCLCGIAAKTGEIIISRDSREDERHTINYSDDSHGNIIIPVKIKDDVIGVLVLFRTADCLEIEIDKDDVKLLYHIGDQIGIAVEKVRMHETTKVLSLHDPLTGLANRRHMDIVLERQFVRTRRYGIPFSIAMLDIDYFKEYNDNYGHTAGDRLLVKIAQILLREVREMDLVVRYGGEEFLILLADTEVLKPYEVCERIRKTVEEEMKTITVSIGVASYHQGIQNEEEIISMADAALYKAKQKGRNRVELTHGKNNLDFHKLSDV
ncbi:MAG: diguanylate cyclase [Nitrospirae bacterium]|nr:diguanylate cyclase [Nitrospirota bacterium]